MMKDDTLNDYGKDPQSISELKRKVKIGNKIYDYSKTEDIIELLKMTAPPEIQERLKEAEDWL